MIPDNVLSSVPVVAPFRIWLRGDRDPYLDFCRGGRGINDASTGLDIQVWRGQLSGGKVIITPTLNPDDTHELNAFAAGGSKLSIAFDNNMQPCATAEFPTGCEFYWYDSTLGGYVTLSIPGARNMIARVDDVRDSSLTTRDIILSYILDDVLCYRQTRDRYQIEYPLQDVHEFQILYQCGMSEGLRFQWQLAWDSERMRIS